MPSSTVDAMTADSLEIRFFVAISADEDVADDRLLDEFFAEIFFQVWTSLEVWIIHYRKLRNAKNMREAFEKRTAKWKQA